jgi:hypothetical protein
VQAAGHRSKRRGYILTGNEEAVLYRPLQGGLDMAHLGLSNAVIGMVNSKTHILSLPASGSGSCY